MSATPITSVAPQVRPSAPRSRARALLVTLWTRDRCPLLILDPRAGHTVDHHVRALHDDRRRVLAWSVTADQVLLLIASRGPDDLVATAHLLRARTAPRLAHLGHRRPWAAIHTLPIRPPHDLAALLEYVLATPVREGLADAWPGWRWAGSRQWPAIDQEFIARHASDRLWLDVVTHDQPDRDPTPRDTAAPHTRQTRAMSVVG